MPRQQRHVFITGATGYMGSRLVPLLLGRGHRVTALTREQSRHKLPAGCQVVIGNALVGDSYRHVLNSSDTFIQLVGVGHPSPAKARQFTEIDLKSGLEAVRVASESAISHFIYVSVAHPAPVMHAYIDARSQCEQALQNASLKSTILRPWYVVGPGHRWPCLLTPCYKLAEAFPATRASARRLGLVTLPQMVNALAQSVDNPPDGIRILEVPEIRTATPSVREPLPSSA